MGRQSRWIEWGNFDNRVRWRCRRAVNLLQRDLDLDHERRILLATPASLIALLRSVSISWQQHEQSQNAREIAAAAQQLYERVVKFTEHFERIRDGLLKTTRAFDDAVGSYDRMIRPSGERLLKLGGGNTTKDLTEIAALEVNPRTIPPRT